MRMARSTEERGEKLKVRGHASNDSLAISSIEPASAITKHKNAEDPTVHVA